MVGAQNTAIISSAVKLDLGNCVLSLAGQNSHGKVFPLAGQREDFCDCALFFSVLQ